MDQIDLKNLPEYIRALNHILMFLKKLQDRNVVVQEVKPPSTQPDYLEEFTYLKDMLKTEKWPHAVDPELIVSSDNDAEKMNRAEGCLEQLLTSDLDLTKLPEDFDTTEFVSSKIKGVNFLDFGCGEGHVVRQAALMGATALGYDIQQQWDDDNALLTTDFGLVEKNGPYDIIFVYDVIDHAKEDGLELIQKIKSLKKPHGRIYIRFHPFVSRTGTHLYKTLNKAYAHLILTEEELIKLGHKGLEVKKLINPLSEYRRWCQLVKLKVVSEKLIRQKVEPFFLTTPIITQRIKMNYPDEKIIVAGLEQQFVDFILV